MHLLWTPNFLQINNSIQSRNVDDEIGTNFNNPIEQNDIFNQNLLQHIVDVDVRMYKKRGISDSSLFYYWDEQLYPNNYNETTAPLEVQFYFYPRPSKDEDNDEYSIFARKPENLLMEDFKNGYYYLAYIDWGDGSQIEFNTEPKKLDFNTIVKHNYEMAGIYEITGYMLRVNFDDDSF